MNGGGGDIQTVNATMLSTARTHSTWHEAVLHTIELYAEACNTFGLVCQLRHSALRCAADLCTQTELSLMPLALLAL